MREHQRYGRYAYRRAASISTASGTSAGDTSSTISMRIVKLCKTYTNVRVIKGCDHARGDEVSGLCQSKGEKDRSFPQNEKRPKKSRRKCILRT